MPSFRTGAVTAVVSERTGFQRVVVGDRPAYVLTELIGTVAVGDRVVVNTTAVDRGLGTGGSDVVHWNLSTDTVDLPGRGHVMAARYLSVQHDAGTWDTDDGPLATSAPHDIEGLVSATPTVASMLHSHAIALCAAIAVDGGPRVGYVWNEAGALPLRLSDLLAQAVDAGVVHVTATVGQAFGGDVEAVTVASAVAGCRSMGADVVVLAPGPGHVGTGGSWSFSGLALAGELDQLAALGAPTAVAVRWSSADRRDRHAGLSHHSVSLLHAAARDHVVPAPPEHVGSVPGTVSADTSSFEPVDVDAAVRSFGLEIDTMGRSLADDDGALAFIGAAATWARTACSPLTQPRA